jgi:hypothetical protein
MASTTVLARQYSIGDTEGSVDCMGLETMSETRSLTELIEDILYGV